jgi:hypothetical protein
MPSEIIDGTGGGYRAKVNSQNRLFTDSVQRSDSSNASLNGDSYNINTGIVNLTSANKSAVLYVKNNETNDLFLENIFYILGNSTGGSGDVLITILRNPTTGTIISSPTDVEMAGINRNFGSAKTLTADMYVGAEGNTFTDGTKVIETVLSGAGQRIPLSAGTIVIPKSSSIGFDITPPASNSSMDVEIALAVHLEI